MWVEEDEPSNASWVRLTDDEQRLYDDLRCDRLGKHIRLEQERISFSDVQHALASFLAHT